MSNKTSVADLIKPKKKYLYACNCIHCNGEEVDPRTQKKHAKEEYLWKSKVSDVNPTRTNSNQSKKRKRDNLDSFQPNKPDNEEGIPPDSFSDSFPDLFAGSFQLNNEEESINTPFSSNFRIPALTLDKNDNDDNYFDEENDYNIDHDYIYQEEDDDDDDDDIDQEEENEDEDNIKNIFASPEFDSDEVFVMESLSDSLETEIILWAFKFQQRFRLTDMALEALIKFLHIVLTRLNKSQFKNFPNSLYMAKSKKYLNIFQPKMQLAVCNNCHKMHNVKDIVA